MMKATVSFVKKNGAESVWIVDVRGCLFMESTAREIMSSRYVSLAASAIPSPP